MMSLSACGTPQPFRKAVAGHAPSLPVTTSHDGLTRKATLSVLTYNIEGLAWPARSGRSGSLARIGHYLSELRENGKGPDIVLVQEMFSGSAKKAVLSAGYPDIVSGPNRTMRPVGATRDHLPGKAKLKRGELGLRFVGSGIAIMSRFPIIDVVKQPYGRRSCPGLDCLSNKGVMLAKIALPGVPVPIEMYNTHMNSRKASKAPKPRHLAAHDRQALEASRFIGNVTDNASPLVFGGDFNMKHSEARWEQFSRYHALKLVHETCSQVPSPCDVRMSW
ncbi:MAG: metal-dependent hydrolase, partial [Alphaproteobacteria bacterium HGW-Alphaproteobacteria-5]